MKEKCAILQLSVLFLALLAGCVADDDGASDDSGESSPAPPPTRIMPAEHVVSKGADPGPPSEWFVVRNVSTPCHAGCFEPMVAASPDGTLAVTQGYNGGIHVSEDEGETWKLLRQPPDVRPRGVFTGDNTIAYAPWGELYFMKIYGEFAASGVLVLSGLHFAISQDDGRTWVHNEFLSLHQQWQNVQADRPWLAFDPDGTVYLSVNTYVPFAPLLEEADPTGIHIARSDDRGRTFEDFVLVAPHGERGAMGQAGAPVVASDGTVHVPMTHQDAAPQWAAYATSEDQGSTWSLTGLEGPEERAGWLPQMALLADGPVVGWRANGSTYSAGPGLGATFLKHTNGTVGPWISALPEGRTYDITMLEPYNAGGDDDLDLKARAVLERVDLEAGTIRTIILGEGIDNTSGPSANTDFAHMTRLHDGRAVVVWGDASPASMYIAVEQPSA